MRFFVGPEYVLVVRVKVQAGLLRRTPSGGYCRIDVSLMDDFRYDLRRRILQGRVRSWQFGAVDGVCRSIFEEEANKSEDAVYCQAEKEEEY